MVIGKPVAAMSELAPGAVYSVEQVEAWLEHIGLPKDFRPEHMPGKDLHALTRIQKYHLSKIPFENLERHYTTHHGVTLEPQELYRRVVGRSHGGYCMQGNSFAEHMLRAIGFSVYSAGARSRVRENGIPKGPWLGWTHQVVIVTLADRRKYLFDVAYGGDCPISPLELNPEIESQNIGQQNRLIQEALGHDKTQKVWVYQIQYTPSGDWYGAFCFTEAEFLPQDFEVMNYYTSTNPSVWIANTLVGVIFIREGEELIGKYTIAHDTIRKNVRGKVEVIAQCKDETERIEGLEKYFGIVLHEDERAAISGWKGALRNV